MKDFHLYITTRGRVEKQTTLESIPKDWLDKTYLVVDKDEAKAHQKLYKDKVAGILIFPGGGNHSGGLSDKRQWVTENALGRYICLLDDDLKFNVRRDGKLVNADNKDINKMFHLMYQWLKEGLAHCAVSPREGNCWCESEFSENTRLLRVLCFDTQVLKKEKIRFDNLPLMSDFDIVLSLLEAGYPNRCTYVYANGQRASNDKGGCSIYRTPELMEKAANGLKKLHPATVTVKKKKTSKPWAGFDTNERVDVDISWRKAFEIGSNRKKSGGGIGKFFKG